MGENGGDLVGERRGKRGVGRWVDLVRGAGVGVGVDKDGGL